MKASTLQLPHIWILGTTGCFHCLWQVPKILGRMCILKQSFANFPYQYVHIQLILGPSNSVIIPQSV